MKHRDNTQLQVSDQNTDNQFLHNANKDTENTKRPRSLVASKYRP
jgi:hypothetical protein